MKYYWKAFLWENGGKSTEYTRYMASPFFYEDRLDETLDTALLTLTAMPISTQHAFPPKTKFRIERYLTADYSDNPMILDMVVDSDNVESFVGASEICTHRINLIEASVIAQNMHVDNIALTYELQDVTLNYKVRTSDDTKVAVGYSDSKTTPVLFFENVDIAASSEDRNSISKRPFANTYDYVWDTSAIDEWKKLNATIDGFLGQEINIPIPTLTCVCTTGGINDALFEMNTITRVYRTETKNGVPVGPTISFAPKISGATSFSQRSDSKCQVTGNTAALRSVSVNINQYGPPFIWVSPYKDQYTVRPTLATASSAYTKALSFTPTPLDEGDAAAKRGYLYTVECQAYPQSDSIVKSYNCNYISTSTSFSIFGSWYNIQSTTPTTATESASRVTVSTSFFSSDMREDVTGGVFLMRPKKYNAYDLLRRAMLTIDTHIIDNELEGIDDVKLPIIVNDDLESRLRATNIFETIFEQKNLWEVMLQVGHYIHAIPYLEFAKDDTDRFELLYRQLGGTVKKDNTTQKLTIFNSQNLSEYFTAFDSYVTNLFSPQNIIEEWLTVTSESDDYLVYNDVAILKTCKQILEVIVFELTYDGITHNLLGAESKLYEESIYQLLSSDVNVSPGKATSLYYTLGDNRIQALTYVPPSANDDAKMALKNIVQRMWGISDDAAREIKFNDLLFHIKYRTQDSLRVTQVRPDLTKYLKNSAYEKYPHHEQFFGQQDKIVDSERFGNNLYGQLIRSGNPIYQIQEYAEAHNAKESGDLVTVNGDDYYVTTVENEFYRDAILQKVTYSKDFNQLSKIVTPPSEARFYEVSERSKTRREVRIMDFFQISTVENVSATPPRFLNNSTWRDFVINAIFYKNVPEFPNCAFTRFTGDKKRIHTGQFGQQVAWDELFPQSGSDGNETLPPQSFAECIVPLIFYPKDNSLVFEWDMENNFKSGDFKDSSQSGGSGDKAYLAIQAHRYCDVMGRADLFNFKLFRAESLTLDQARSLPKAEYIPNDAESQIYLSNKHIVLEKDNREALSFNYDIHLLHSASESDGEDFITAQNIWGEKNGRLKMCLCASTKTRFDKDISLELDDIITDVDYDFDFSNDNVIKIVITEPENVNLSEVNSIVVYDLVGDERLVYIVKNVSKTDNKLADWWIYPVFNS